MVSVCYNIFILKKILNEIILVEFGKCFLFIGMDFDCLYLFLYENVVGIDFFVFLLKLFVIYMYIDLVLVLILICYF